MAVVRPEAQRPRCVRATMAPSRRRVLWNRVPPHRCCRNWHDLETHHDSYYYDHVGCSRKAIGEVDTAPYKVQETPQYLLWMCHRTMVVSLVVIVVVECGQPRSSRCRSSSSSDGTRRPRAVPRPRPVRPTKYQCKRGRDPNRKSTIAPFVRSSSSSVLYYSSSN